MWKVVKLTSGPHFHASGLLTHILLTYYKWMLHILSEIIKKNVDAHGYVHFKLKSQNKEEWSPKLKNVNWKVYVRKGAYLSCGSTSSVPPVKQSSTHLSKDNEVGHFQTFHLAVFFFFFPAFPSRVQAAQFLTFSCQRESIVDGMRTVTSALVLQRQWWQSGSLRHNGGNQRRVVFNPKERKKTFINQQSLNLMAKIERFSVCAWVQVPNPSLGEPSGCLKSNLHSR